MDQKILEFSQIISMQVGISKDDQQRQLAEKAFTELRAQQPNLFIQLLVGIIQNSPDVAQRQFCSSQIRKSLSNFSEKSFANLWQSLDPETQALVKTSLLHCLQNEGESKVRNLICDAIGEIGGTLLQTPELGNQWPELLQILWSLFQSDSPVILESAFRILNNLITYASDVFDQYHTQLHTLFTNALAMQNRAIKAEAIAALGNLITVLNPKELKQFQDLAVPLLQQTQAILLESEEDGQDCMDVIIDVCENEPAFFKKRFELFFDTMHAIFSNITIENSGIKRQGTEAILCVIDRLPSLVKKNERYLRQLLEMIFWHMIDIDEEITPEWERPPEGFNEDIEEDEDFETTRFGMDSIDRLIQTVGNDIVIPQLSQTVQSLLASEDWRYKFAAIMALSQVGEYIEQVENLTGIVQAICKFLNDPNSKIRYAVYHALGQIAEDRKTDFQEKYYAEIIPILLKGTEENVPRVQAHAMAALTNFVEGCGPVEIKNFVEKIIQRCFELLRVGISIAKENSMSCLGGVAEAARDDFQVYFQECLPQIFAIFQNHQGPEYKQLRGCVIETITIIAESIEKEVFLPHFADTVNMMLAVSNAQMELVDPQKNFILTGWQRLCQTYSNELVPYLPHIMPPIYQIIQRIFKENAEAKAKSNELVENEGTEEHQNTFQHQEAETSLNMLHMFIQNLGENFINYVEDCTKIIAPLCNFDENANIRDSASKCLPALVKCVESQPAAKQQLVRMFIGILYNAAQQEFEPEVIAQQMQSMKLCIESCGQFLSKDELNEFSQKIIKILIDSDTRKVKSESIALDQDVDEEERYIYQVDKEFEEDLHVAIAELLGILFKTHRDLCSDLASYIYQQFLPNCLLPNQSNKMHKFGIFLIDDMVEFLGYDMIHTVWDALLQALLTYAISDTCYVRQAAVYGLGMFAIKTPPHAFTSAEKILETLKQAVHVPKKADQREKEYGHAKDNSIASFGKVLKAHGQTLAATSTLGVHVNFWLYQLPLRFDKPEARPQHEFLCDLILAQPNLVFQKNEDVLKVLQIFGDIIGTKFIDKETTTPKIRLAIQYISAQDSFRTLQIQIFNQLTPEQREKLKEVN